MNLGKAIKFFRVGRGMNQERLAQTAGISISHLCLMETGKRESTISTVKKVAGALGVPVTLLIYAASTDKEKAALAALDPQICEKLSHATLNLIEV
jgi:transcriptional regulator with XRE-family HTH domain